MTITIKDFKSEHFPIEATWNKYGLKYSDVFCSKDAAIKYFIGRFGSIRVIDKTTKKEKTEG